MVKVIDIIRQITQIIMAVREIVRMGHPTLRKVAEPYPIQQIGSDSFFELVEDMRETLHCAGGIGLAAPQIDVPFQIAVVEITDPITRYGEIQTLPFEVYINPTITVENAASAGYWEGCLSVPGMMGFVERPQHIRVDYLDSSAEKKSMQLKGFLATVFQHEFDHLLGKLYVDRISDMSLFSFDLEYQLYHLNSASSQS